MKSVISAVGESIKSAIAAIKTVFSSLAQSGTNLKSMLSVAWNGIKSVVSIVTSSISGFIENIKSFFTGLLNSCNSLSSGVQAAWNTMKNGVSAAVSAITGFIEKVKNAFNTVRNIDLSGAGTAIMDGFLGGLKAAWGKVQSFVGGIADWVRAHKGPISYDKKLLVPAGQAIMSGLNQGLVSGFSDVKRDVLNISDAINDMFLADKDFNLDYSLASNVVSTPANYDIKDNQTKHNQDTKTPLKLVLQLNGREFYALVADITDIQNQTIKLQSQY